MPPIRWTPTTWPTSLTSPAWSPRGVHDSPVGVADFVTGSTHKTIRAAAGGIIMCDEAYADDIDSAVFPACRAGPSCTTSPARPSASAKPSNPSSEAYAEQTVANAKALADRPGARPRTRLRRHRQPPRARRPPPLPPDTTGKAVEEALEDAGIVLNANTVPGETRSAFNPSGIRAGTPGLTTRGFDEDACREVADLIAEVVDSPDDDDVFAEVAERVDELTDTYPLYD